MTSLKQYALAAVLGLLALAGLAVPWYSSRTLDTELKAFAEASRKGDVVVHKLAHQAGLFKSTGTIEFQVRDSCEAAAPAAAAARRRRSGPRRPWYAERARALFFSLQQFFLC